MLNATMFDDGLGWTLSGDILADLVVIIPTAIAVLASLWGVRVAFSYLKGIARQSLAINKTGFNARFIMPIIRPASIKSNKTTSRISQTHPKGATMALGGGLGTVHKDDRINQIELITREPATIANYERLKAIEASLIADDPANKGQVSFYVKLYEDDLKEKGLI